MKARYFYALAGLVDLVLQFFVAVYDAILTPVDADLYPVELPDQSKVPT